VSRPKQYREVVFCVAIVVGIIGAIAAYSAFVNEPIPETPSVFEDVNLSNVFLILMLVPTVFVQWGLFAIELFRIWWTVILCGVAPFCFVWAFYKIIGLTLQSEES
jgi:hypothetical protein